MSATRRTFLKGAAVTCALGFDLAPAHAQSRELKIARTTETRSTCPYCSVSCGIIIHTLGDKAKNVTPQVVHVEGDPDHPINRGTLCPKGSSLQQDIVNDRRLLKPQVRRPGSDRWEDISWETALDEIARKLKTTRDANNRRRVPQSEITRLSQSPQRHRAVVGHSARNRFPGVVTRIDKDRVVALVEIEAGPHRITAAVTRDAVEELGLAPGVTATAAVKATSVMVDRG